jgi:hypothetical protein
MGQGNGGGSFILSKNEMTPFSLARLLDRAGPFMSLSKSSGPGSRRQKQPVLRQHFLKDLPEPQGQRSFLPSFSVSSLVPWTTRTPRFTLVSDGKLRLRLLIGSKKTAGRQNVAGP